MENETQAQARLAVLIDADNAQPGHADDLLAEIAKYGVASVKRIYGDWTTPQLGKWKAILLQHSIQPIQQFRYTVGKNATDSAMIIDAMDLLYTRKFDGFCLVSSDSDFTRLAARLRESGLTVYGFGERKTPKPFVAACDKFIYTENLGFDDAGVSDGDGDGDGDAATAGAGAKQVKRATSAQLKGDASLVNLLRNAVEAASEDDGWARLSSIGEILTKQRPDFDSRSYGYAKLSSLVRDLPGLEVQELPVGNGLSVLHVREAPSKPRKHG